MAGVTPPPPADRAGIRQIRAFARIGIDFE
jgi:hypothetical protein